MIRRILTTACALVALGLLYACGSERLLAPAANSWYDGGAKRPANADRSDPNVDTVAALKRSDYLANDISESAFIGPEGGEIDIDQTGSSIVFSPGAFSRRTRVTMTVKAGWNVAFEFAPHGIVFAAPVTVQQELSYTVADNPSNAAKLQAGYFQRNLDSIFLDMGQSVARVSELRHASIGRRLNSLVANFSIYHFSGYLMSSGFAGGGGDTAGIDSLP